MSKKKNNRAPQKKNSALRTVELNPVVSWTCDDCGTENYWHVLMAQTPGGVITNAPEAVQCGSCGAQFVIDEDSARFEIIFRRSDEHGGCDDVVASDDSDVGEPDADDEDVELKIEGDDEWDVEPGDDDDDFDDDFDDDDFDDEEAEDEGDDDDDDGVLFGDDDEEDDDEDDWGDDEDDEDDVED